MKNLLNIVNDVVSGNTLDAVAKVIGSDAGATSSAVSKFAPAIIGSLINKGETTSGAQSLIDLFKKNNYGDNQVGDLLGIFGNKEKTSGFMDMGSNILGSLFGSRQSSITDTLINMTGLGKGVGGMLLKLLAPIIVNKLAGGIFKNNWGASQLSSYLTGQKSEVYGKVPGLSNILGFAADSGSTRSASTASTTTTTRATQQKKSSGGGGWWKWLLPLLLLLGLAWFFTRGCSGTDKVANTKTTTKTTHTPSTTTTTTSKTTPTSTDNAQSSGAKVDPATVDYKKFRVAPNGDIIGADGYVKYKGSDYSFDANGNVIDKMGTILVPAAALPADLKEKLKVYLGKYAGTKLMRDDNGNIVDATGKILVKKGDFIEKDGFYYDKSGNKLGRIWDKIVKAVSDAAEKTVDGMKNFFAGMFSKKPGAKTSYELTQIEFNKKNHRITNFSKAELQGLAAALKADKNSKINVNVYTNDGKDSKENKKLSKIRAEVVRDMLVTLGVNKKQLDFTGMGDKNSAKAASDKVEITVR